MPGQFYVQGEMVPSLYILVEAQSPVPYKSTQGGQSTGGKRTAEPRGVHIQHSLPEQHSMEPVPLLLPQGQEQVYGMPQACPADLPKGGSTHKACAVARLAHLCLLQQTAPSGR